MSSRNNLTLVRARLAAKAKAAEKKPSWSLNPQQQQQQPYHHQSLDPSQSYLKYLPSNYDDLDLHSQFSLARNAPFTPAPTFPSASSSSLPLPQSTFSHIPTISVTPDPLNADFGFPPSTMDMDMSNMQMGGFLGPADGNYLMGMANDEGVPGLDEFVATALSGQNLNMMGGNVHVGEAAAFGTCNVMGNVEIKVELDPLDFDPLGAPDVAENALFLQPAQTPDQWLSPDEYLSEGGSSTYSPSDLSDLSPSSSCLDILDSNDIFDSTDYFESEPVRESTSVATESTASPTKSPSSSSSSAPSEGAVAKKPANRGPRKMFKCTLPGCTKEFTRKYNLASHIRCHSGERPFVCPHCTTTEVSFARKHDLRRHIKSLHSEMRPHRCTHCNLSFSRSDALKRHLAIEAKRMNGGAEGAVAAVAGGDGSMMEMMEDAEMDLFC
ncbi:hypothetical protein HK104_004215 [Borealophlyctis nickersoniae]|nr:hypothetical protein HK104_004215 [Borealophlyctis nickersoniae]